MSFSVEGRPHTIGIPGTHSNADLVSFNGGFVAFGPYPTPCGHSTALAPPRQYVTVNYHLDEVGILQSDHAWMETHTYSYKMPTENADRLKNLY
jgi:hypothetical protein